MRPVPVLSALIAAALVAAGCGGSVSIEVGGKGFDREKAQKKIADLVERQVGAQVRSVSCPSDVKLERGVRFRCTVTGLDGTTGPALVRLKDDKGDSHISAPLLHVREAEQAISAGIARKLGGQVLVRCPEIVQVVPGRRFSCRATKGKDRARVAVQLEDAKGHFRYRVE